LSPDYLKLILRSRVYDVAEESPLQHAPALSQRLGTRLLLKREDLHPVHSFKLRGAYNKMAHLTAAERARGVICASAGNHAQGVALAAQKLQCAATIVMPTTTPQIKVDAVTARGARVLLKGDSYHEAYLASQELAAAECLTFVHPYDDPLVIAGQGTIGMEILRQYHPAHPEGDRDRPIHAIFVPVGGGGLIAGISAYVKALSPRTRIVGVEPEDSNAMQAALKAGRRVTLPHVNIFADGVAVKQVGKETFRLARKWIDDMLLVDTDEICAALKDIFEDTRSIMEPSGGLAVAAAKRYAARRNLKEETLVAICCGANMNFDRLRFVAERAELGEAREAVLAVTLPEQPGAFRTLCSALGKRAVTEFNYRYAAGNAAHIFLGVQLMSASEKPALISQLKRAGIPALDLSDNEMAKLHARHMVGGRAPHDLRERLFRFEFPERPGALMNFLTHMRAGWNITLFHYRNHGADYGRVLVGMQFPDGGRAFAAFASELGYEYVEETRNPAYRLFLK
jgi:threonine dehydratase